MRYAVLTLLGAILAIAPAQGSAQAPDVVEPFAVGTYSVNGREFAAIVLREQFIVEIEPANRSLQQSGNAPAVAVPTTILDLIEQYESGMKSRIYAIVNHVVQSGQLTAAQRPPYIHTVDEVGFLPPIRYPGKMLNAAVNFFSHACEACTAEERQQIAAQRTRERGVPYLFLKPTRGALIGHGENVVLRHGRDRTDWEVELGIVIGRPARNVSAARAQDYVFGFTIHNDVSDRGGRPPGGFGLQSDWFVGKGAETFAPLGPWIVPKEFYGDPMERLYQTLSIDGHLVQEATASDMIHSVWELIEYGSSIITLFPGDVINAGTTSGTSSGAFFAGTRSGYLKPGEVMEAHIEGIGTLRNPVVAGPPLPSDLTGAALPAVDSYRQD